MQIYGCVQIKITDKGKDFCNEISEALDKITGVKHNITSAYHPQSNGLVQRMNRTLKGILIKSLGEDGDWVKDLQPVLFSYRTSKHSSTRKTPYEVLFHKKAILPIDVKEDISNTEEEISEGDLTKDKNKQEIKDSDVAAVKEKLSIDVKEDSSKGDLTKVEDKKKQETEDSFDAAAVEEKLEKLKIIRQQIIDDTALAITAAQKRQKSIMTSKACKKNLK